jgi:hypothetical protein
MALAALGALAACGSAVSFGAGGLSDGSIDSGSPESGGGDGPHQDSGVSDTGLTEAQADAGSPTAALFIHASPSLPDLRLCWSIAGNVTEDVPLPSTGTMPGSNYAGIPVGGAVGVGDLSSELLEGEVTFYAVAAASVAQLDQGSTPPTCHQLICGPSNNPSPPCLRMNGEYWPLATLPLGAVAAGGAGSTDVVAVSGCLASLLDPSATAARCGPTWTSAAGNLHAELTYATTATPQDAGQLTVQATLLSPALAEALGDAGIVVSFGPQDGGVPVASLVAEDEVQPWQPVALSLGSGLAAFGQLGFSVTTPGFASGQQWMSLIESQQLVAPTEDPALFFGQGRTYLVAVVGDPGANADAAYDGTGLHVLVLATPVPQAPGRDL